MSSYLSNLLTQTTSHYKQIRRTLLSNEEDGDTEDDSHITRVLRAYHTEKGRPFPPWLPPDPNERRPPPPQAYGSTASGYFSNASARPPMNSIPAQAPPPSRSSLSDLWNPPAQSTAPMAPQSLRNTRRPGAPSMPSSNNTSNNLAPPPQARPLPSQRAGSYQNLQPQAASRPPLNPTPPSSSGSGTAQDRLKARLYGNRAASPANGGSATSNPGNPYGSGGGYGR